MCDNWAGRKINCLGELAFEIDSHGQVEQARKRFLERGVFHLFDQEIITIKFWSDVHLLDKYLLSLSAGLACFTLQTQKK